MLENILELERGLFFALNGSESAFFDRFMWLYSGKTVWFPLAAFLIIILLYKKGWKESLFIVIAIALVVTLCDQFASGLCKPMFERFRPTHHPDFMNEVDTVFGYRGGRFGFMSSHSANAFGFATFMGYLFRHSLFTWVIYFWAALTAYSRIYLGVHFISDVIPAAIAGMVLGYFVYRLYKWARFHILVKSGEYIPIPDIYTKYQKQLSAYGVLVTVMILLVFNSVLTNLLR